MSIDEVLKKIKDLADRHTTRLDGVLVILALILTLISGFAIGRLSFWESVNDEEIEVLVLPHTPAAELSASLIHTNDSTTLPPPPSTELTSGPYVASREGSVYHGEHCSGAKRIKEENKIWFQSESEARAAGFHPAKNCPGLLGQ